MRNGFIVIDFETTGLSPLNAQVIEIGAVKFKDGRLVDQFEVLLKATVPVEPGAFQAHKISSEYLAEHGREPKAEWSKLHQFIENLPLVAHNGIRFDFQFIYNAFSLYKLAHGNNWLVDTLILAPAYLKTVGGYNQHDLCQAYGIENKSAHRALGDVMALAELVKIIAKQESVMERHWQACGSGQLHALGELPPGFEKIQAAMDQGLDIQIRYQGKDKSASNRWIRPLHIEVSRGRRYIVSICRQDDIKKSFLSSGILGVLGFR